MIKILVADDEKPISNLIKLSLTKAGYTCSCAFNGMEVADMVDNESFDLILLDVMMPEVDGFELMDYLKPKGIPVIFITARNSVDDRVKGLKLGADDYIVKPFEILELLARVEVVLRRFGHLSKSTNKSLAKSNGIRACLGLHSELLSRKSISLKLFLE